MYRLPSSFSIFTVLFFILSLTGISVAQTVPGKNLNTHATGITGTRGVSHDSDGNAYTMGRDTGTVFKITPSGTLSVVKEMGTGFYVGPFFDQATGDIYISNCTGAILRLNPLTGAVSTLATVGTSCAGGFTSDATGNIYVSDFSTSVVKITPSGSVSTYATGLSSPDGIDFGPDGELYVGNRGTNQVLVVAPGGGAASVFASGLNNPLDVLADDSGNVFAANFGNGTLSKITPGGTVSTIGTGFANPLGLAFDITDNLIIADFGTAAIYSAGPLVLFSDTFDNDPVASGTTSLSNWTVTNGNVDVIGPGFADLYTGNGDYLDMDGAISNATIESPILTLSPGTYELSFELGNNSNLGSFDNGVLVSLGTVFSQTFLAPAHANFSGEQLVKTTIRFVIENPTSASLIFQETGTASSGGAVVDDVLLVKTDVIEPLPANTEVVFSGAFDDETSSSLSNDWSITAGNVDLILDDLGGTYPGNGKFVDMDGTGANANATIVSNQSLSLTPGTYHLTFGLGDNPYINNDSELNINLGTVFHQSLKAPIGRPALEFYHYEFTVIAGSTGTLSFQEIGTADWRGTILDDVLLVRIVTNQAPIADAGSNQTVEQASSSGANVTLDGSGSNDPDTDTFTYSWTGVFGTASGATPTVLIPAGTYTVTLVVNDGVVDSEPATMSVTVQDTTAPEISVAEHTVEATGPSTPVDVSNDASATDDVGVDSLTNDSPGIFAANVTTPVTWIACDVAGNCATAVQNVIVLDTTSPDVMAPAAVTLEATATLTPVILGAGTASDLVDGPITPIANPLGPFAVGVHTVTWTATDSQGNAGTGTQTVTVTDTTAPSIATPADLTVAATGSLTPVTLVAPTVSDLVTIAANITVTSDAPTAGFPVDSTTTVTWTATDEANNSVSVSHTVTVEKFVLGLSTGKTRLKVHHDHSKKHKDKDKLEVKGRYSEFVNGDGLGFTSEPVSITLGGLSWNLSAGSFVKDIKKGGKIEWKYKGPKSGLREVKFDSEGKFKIKVERIDLSGIPSGSPVPLSITIGNDSGDTTATFKAKKEGHDKDKDKDKDHDKKGKGKKKGKK
jgi:hypothetical protein